MPESTETDVIRIASRAVETEKILKELKAELEELTTLFQSKRNAALSVRLAAENEELRRQVEEYKSQLQHLEVQHKVPQIARPPFPRDPGSTVPVVIQPPAREEMKVSATSEHDVPASTKIPKNQKNKPEKTKTTGGDSTKAETVVDVSRLDLRVGRILSAKKHPGADSLYVEEVDVGEKDPRCVVSGLVKHVPLEEMQDRLAVLLCNLKPANMRGVSSQAMVMCASTPEKVEILVPPPGSQPGDEVSIEGYPRNPDKVLNPKHKVFETVAPDLKTDANQVATYKGTPWNVPGKGPIIAPTLTGAPIK